MAERRPTVLIALADRRRAEELAAHLAEGEGMIAVLTDEVDPGGAVAGRFDAVVSDDPARAESLPTVLLADVASGALMGGAARAVLRPGAADPLIAAAVRLIAAGYTVAAGERPAGSPQRRNEPELL